VPKRRRARFVALDDLLARRRPDVDVGVIAEGRLLVDGRMLANPRALVRLDASLRVVTERRLRGDVKLSHAIHVLAVPIAGRIAVDVGASAGGFTTALLEHGASRVYAVDAGVGQLRGRLRSDPRVVNLEGHNLATVDASLVPDVIEVVAMDLSYLAVAAAVPQLSRLGLDVDADLIALVKPTFELRSARLAASDRDVIVAVDRAELGMVLSGWQPVGRCDAPAAGQRRAREAFIHARRQGQRNFENWASFARPSNTRTL
jgi:23S rRNA (cytidine1920-2'-O)/16S rRNA (cytidine1409-2'-O)-methyltransferase